MSQRLIFSLVVTLGLVNAVATQAQVQQPGNGVSLPVVLKEVKPTYTAKAKEERIQGVVWVQVVVRADGNVGDVQVTRSLDKEFGLDNQAVQAARQWQFKPGTKDGKPVDVTVTLEMTFTLK